MCRGKVRVARGMAHQFLDGSDIDASHDRAAAEGMSQDVPRCPRRRQHVGLLTLLIDLGGTGFGSPVSFWREGGNEYAV